MLSAGGLDPSGGRALLDWGYTADSDDITVDAKRQLVVEKGECLRIDVNFGRPQPRFLHKRWPFVISKALNVDQRPLLNRLRGKCLAIPNRESIASGLIHPDIDWATPGTTALCSSKC